MLSHARREHKHRVYAAVRGLLYCGVSPPLAISAIGAHHASPFAIGARGKANKMKRYNLTVTNSGGMMLAGVGESDDGIYVKYTNETK